MSVIAFLWRHLVSQLPQWPHTLSLEGMVVVPDLSGNGESDTVLDKGAFSTTILKLRPGGPL